jgi:aryl-alcohol dehydrogenase-like predicted oxidoreductase
VPEGVSVPQAALKWILEQRGVTAVIPGARNAEQAHSNAGAASVPELGADFGAAVAAIYDRYFREAMHPRW